MRLGSYRLDCLESFLLLYVVKSVRLGYVHFFLVFGRSAKTILFLNKIAVAIETEVFEFIFGPDLFMDALGPCLVLVVVTYHYFFFQIFVLYI